MVAYGAVSLYHLDCFSGLSGDMFLGACLDLGLPLRNLRESIENLGLRSIAFESRQEERGGLRGTRFLVSAQENESTTQGARGASGTHEHPVRGYGEIRRLIADSSLDEVVRERALLLFSRLAEAESRVHGVPVEDVHFHEVGALDSIVDLVGTAVAWEWLHPERLTCGEVNVGQGLVVTSHGSLPVPAPATAELLQGIPVYATEGGELLTPTGCVILAELVDQFTAGPELVVDGVGYGLGARDIVGHPNVTRLWRGKEPTAALHGEVVRSRAMVIECELDDLSAEGLGFVMERILERGALDVYFTPVQMKKCRPGTLVTIICREQDLEPLATLMLIETGSLGCRFRSVHRFEAERWSEEVATPFGIVKVKRGRFAGREIAMAPEFDDCRKIALERGVPWREVYQAALDEARRNR